MSSAASALTPSTARLVTSSGGKSTIFTSAAASPSTYHAGSTHIFIPTTKPTHLWKGTLPTTTSGLSPPPMMPTLSSPRLVPSTHLLPF